MNSNPAEHYAVIDIVESSNDNGEYTFKFTLSNGLQLRTQSVLASHRFQLKSGDIILAKDIHEGYFIRIGQNSEFVKELP